MNANGEGRHRGVGFNSMSHTFSAKGGECTTWREKGRIMGASLSFSRRGDLIEEEPEPVNPCSCISCQQFCFRMQAFFSFGRQVLHLSRGDDYTSECMDFILKDEY